MKDEQEPVTQRGRAEQSSTKVVRFEGREGGLDLKPKVGGGLRLSWRGEQRQILLGMEGLM